MKKVQEVPWWKYERIDPKSTKKKPTPWWKYRSLDWREQGINGVRHKSEFNSPLLILLLIALLVMWIFR